MKTNLSGKLSVSTEPEPNQSVEVKGWKEVAEYENNKVRRAADSSPTYQHRR